MQIISNVYGKSLISIVRGFEKKIFVKTVDSSYVKESSNTLIKNEITTNESGYENKMTIEIPTEEDLEQNITLYVVDDATTCIVDSKENIDANTPSTIIKNRETNNVEKLVITGETYEAAYAGLIDKMRLSMYQDLEISKTKSKSSFEYKFYDLICLADKKDTSRLICEQEFVLTVKSTDAVIDDKDVSEQIKKAISVIDSYLDGINSELYYDIQSYVDLLEEIENEFSSDGIMGDYNHLKLEIEDIEERIIAKKMDRYYIKIQGKDAREYLIGLKEDFRKILDKISNNLY